MSTDEQVELQKMATGITGLDAVSRGGLPAHGSTLISGGTGCGKTVLAMNILVNRIHANGNVLFFSFEESRDEMLRNTASFDWDVESLLDERLILIDARPPDDVTVSGPYDIAGLLSVLTDLAEKHQPSCVAFDGIDQLVTNVADLPGAVREIRRLHRWLEKQQLAAIFTAKTGPVSSERTRYLEDLKYLFSTVIELHAELIDRRLSRTLRIIKYRGTAHVLDEVPLVITESGMKLPYFAEEGTKWKAHTERISTGVPRLDSLLGGGFFRGTGILVSGEPGTSKTSLAAIFLAAAAARGEKALFISFDEAADQIVRNVASIGIDLQTHRDSGKLVITTLRASNALMEEHYLRILELLETENPDCLVIDPVSALLKAGGGASSHVSIERLLDNIRSKGISILMTSLMGTGTAGHEETTAARVSTIADTWIVLNNRVINGERNRALSIVKSRGTRHSNQMRELILSDQGIELADVYAYGSEVLLGTARVEKEQEEALRRRREDIERQRQRRNLEYRLAQTRGRAGELDHEVRQLQDELELNEELNRVESDTRTEWREEIMRSRFSDHGTGAGGSKPDGDDDREEH